MGKKIQSHTWINSHFQACGSIDQQHQRDEVIYWCATVTPGTIQSLVQLGTSGSRWKKWEGAKIDKMEKQQKALFWLRDPRNVPERLLAFSIFSRLCGKRD